MRRPLLVLVLLMMGRFAVAEEFAQDFRDQQFSEASLRIVGSQDLVFKEREGLRVAIRKDSGAASNSGVVFPLQLMGDCQMEATVELIDVPAPKGGFGTGVALLLEDGGTNGASLQSVVMPDGKHIYVAHKYHRNAEGEYKHDAKSFPATGNNAVLKIGRQGQLVKYFVVDDGGTGFRELASYAFTAEPLQIAQVYGQTGGEPNDLNVRITDFRVGAEAILRRGQKRRKKPLPMMWVVVGVLIGLAVVGGAVWRYRRSRD